MYKNFYLKTTLLISLFLFFSLIKIYSQSNNFDNSSLKDTVSKKLLIAHRVYDEFLNNEVKKKYSISEFKVIDSSVQKNRSKLNSLAVNFDSLQGYEKDSAFSIIANYIDSSKLYSINTPKSLKETNNAVEKFPITIAYFKNEIKNDWDIKIPNSTAVNISQTYRLMLDISFKNNNNPKDFAIYVYPRFFNLVPTYGISNCYNENWTNISDCIDNLEKKTFKWNYNKASYIDNLYSGCYYILIYNIKDQKVVDNESNFWIPNNQDSTTTFKYTIQ